MQSILGASWKTSLAGILSVFLPPILWYVLTTMLKLDSQTATQVSTGLFALLVSAGLMNAKDHNVSNSPTPMKESQTVPNPAPGVPTMKQ